MEQTKIIKYIMYGSLGTLFFFISSAILFYKQEEISKKTSNQFISVSQAAARCDWKTQFCGPGNAPPSNVDIFRRILESMPEKFCGTNGYARGSSRGVILCRNFTHIFESMPETLCGTDGYSVGSNKGRSKCSKSYPNRNLKVSGNVFADSYFHASDRNFKENIKPITNLEETLSNLEGVQYTMKDDPAKIRYGFIAQEVEKILPELVEGEEGNKSVNYTDVIPILLETVKRQDKRIRELENRF